MSEVFFKKGTYDDFLRFPHSFLEGFRKAGFEKVFEKGSFLGFKIHFGEKGNLSYINPSLLLPLVKLLRERKIKPFLFETNTLYRGQRSNSIDHITLARSHGFGKLNLPIIIGDGLQGNNYTEVKITQKHLSTFYLAQALEDIDALLVLSHFTGHMLTGFGAAIKNLGMGCASRRGKLAQHCTVTPRINEKKCVACGTCAAQCPVDAITKKGRSYVINEERCIGCAQCITVCPHAAVKIIWSEAYKLLGEKMVEYAFAVTKKIRCVYVNVCLYITKECDCMNTEKTAVTPDVGILFSWDPVSIDKASLDLLAQREKKDFIGELHPQVPYSYLFHYAEEIGLGSLDYTFIEI